MPSVPHMDQEFGTTEGMPAIFTGEGYFDKTYPIALAGNASLSKGSVIPFERQLVIKVDCQRTENGYGGKWEVSTGQRGGVLKQLLGSTGLMG